jgi:hypothetical protein
VSADNAGLAFRGDGQQLAFTARDAARLWDVGTGEVLGSWLLGRGWNDALAFTPAGQLLAARVEAQPGNQDQDWRLRELVCPDSARTIAEHKSLNGFISGSVAALDGSCFVIKVGRDERTFVIAFDGHTGAERWSLTIPKELRPGLAHDPEGRLLSCFPHEQAGQGIVVDMASGKQWGTLTFPPDCLSPGADYLVMAAGGREPGFALVRRGDSEPLVELGIDAVPSCSPLFSRDGSRLAWGNRDGTVTVYDPQTIREQLDRVGLGW